MRAIGESKGYWRAQEQLFGTLRTARDSRMIQKRTQTMNTIIAIIEHFYLTIKSLIDAYRPITKLSICR